jgi:integrin alpha 7
MCDMTFIITRYAWQEQVFYGGDVKGESAMKTFNDIGTSVVHTFQVTFQLHVLKKCFLLNESQQINNDGPWKAPHVEVDIDWPHQVGNDKPLGKWLLYLEGVPIVESTSGGECTISKELVNPLKLKAHEDAASLTASSLQQDRVFNKRTNKSHTFAMEYREKSSTEKKPTGDENILNRVRRDRSMIIRADKLVDVDGKKTNTVTMVIK